MDYDEEMKHAAKFFNQCQTTMKKKANDYAQETDVFSNFKKIAYTCDLPTEKTFLVFMSVKLARIAELINTDKEANNESIEDSLADLANYACLMSIYLKDK